MTRAPDDVTAVLRLHTAGHPAVSIARLTGIPRSTIRDWIGGRVPKEHRLRNTTDDDTSICAACGHSKHNLSEVSEPYLYLLGLYLGDGCISAHPRAVYKLRMFLDARYPGIIETCQAAIRQLAPRSKVNRQGRRSNYVERVEFSTVEVWAYSKSWPCLFPQHGPGKKHHRRIVLTDWQRELVLEHPEPLLTGLIHSDGCRFMNTGRGWRSPRYSFSNLSDDIRRIFCEACDALGVGWTTAPRTVYVSRVADVARLDEFIGPKA